MTFPLSQCLLGRERCMAEYLVDHLQLPFFQFLSLKTFYLDDTLRCLHYAKDEDPSTKRYSYLPILMDTSVYYFCRSHHLGCLSNRSEETFLALFGQNGSCSKHYYCDDT